MNDDGCLELLKGWFFLLFICVGLPVLTIAIVILVFCLAFVTGRYFVVDVFGW